MLLLFYQQQLHRWEPSIHPTFVDLAYVKTQLLIGQFLADAWALQSPVLKANWSWIYLYPDITGFIKI